VSPRASAGASQPGRTTRAEGHPVCGHPSKSAVACPAWKGGTDLHHPRRSTVPPGPNNLSGSVGRARIYDQHVSRDCGLGKE
jgi:hypothetical protein